MKRNGATWREDAGPDPTIVEEIAARIAAARLAGRTTEMLPRTLYPIWSEIYDVHDRVDTMLGWECVGWKVGAASEEVQRSEDMPGPIAGRIYARGLHASGATLGSELFVGYRQCESEFVLTLNDDLPPGAAPLTVDAVAEAIGTVRPALEVGDMVWPDWYGSNPFWGACLDNAGGSQLVLGEPIPFEPSMDLARWGMRLYCDGKLVKSGTGRAAMGDPLISATWLVNLRRQRGDHVRAGALLSTGTCTGHFFARPGNRMLVDFDHLGTVEATFDEGHSR